MEKITKNYNDHPDVFNYLTPKSDNIIDENVFFVAPKRKIKYLVILNTKPQKYSKNRKQNNINSYS